MEKKFTLVFSLLFVCFLHSFAAAPTVPSSSLEYTTVEGDKLTLRFRKGDGQFRIVVMKEGAAIGTLPVNGTEYTASAAFGLPASAFTNSDGFVVYKGSTSATQVSVAVTNLKPATTYYISIFEYNGSGVATEYQTVALTGSKATLSAPVTQGSFKPASNIIGNSVTLNWNVGSGEKRLIVGRKASAVNADPLDLKQYNGNTNFGDGNIISGDNYAVYSGSANTAITVNQLEPNTTYYFSLYEYNGTSGPMYLRPAATTMVHTNAGPTKASGPINFVTVDGNRLTTSFAKGNGAHQLIIGRKGQAVSAQPVNGQTYTSSTEFGHGDEIAPGEFVLNSLGNDRIFTNLDPYSVYHFRIYDFDIDANGNTYYLTNLYSQASSSTATPPTTQVSAIEIQSMTGASVSLRYTTGDSKYRLIVVKAGAPVDAVPVDLTKYEGGSANYGQGRTIGDGNYVINGATNSNAATISMLTPGVTYHIAIWGWNGFDYPIYKQDPARYELTIPNEPAAAGTNFTTSQVEGNSFFSSWSGGDGARRIVIARKGAAVTAKPVDGQIYTADNDFGEGSPVEDGQFVVQDGTARGFTLRKLEAGAVYYLAVFEYNVTNNLPDYRISTFLTGQCTTLAAPTSQAQIISADQIQTNSARINFSKGNGTGRLLIMRANDAVSVSPQDFATYNWTGSYGSGDNLGNGNYVVGSPSNLPITVLGLAPNTVYHVAIFEYNGSAGPVYLRPGATYQFTTAANGGGTTAPTVNATSSSFIVDGNKLTFDWHKGDGAKRIVVMKQGGDITFTPADGTDYSAQAPFGTGADQGGGQFVVYNGNMEEAVITNLQPSTNYSLVVYEYNGTGATAHYLVAGALSVQQSTAVAPTGAGSAVNVQTTASSVMLNWQEGDGDGRIVVMKEGSAVEGQPADLGKYPPNAEFKQGAQIALGEYVVYAGAGNSVVITGLDAAKTYYFSVFEYNGVDAPVYNKTEVLQGQAITTGSLPLTWVYFTAKAKQGSVALKWSTTDEINTASFVIERSTGGPFVALDSIASMNTPGDHDYTYTDVNVPAGSVQYRIRQVDIDRKYAFSKVVVLNISAGQGALSLYPNPARESLKIGLPTGMSRAKVSIYDAGGKQVMTRMVNNGEVMAISKLRQGIYTVLVEDGEKRFVERLMKL